MTYDLKRIAATTDGSNLAARLVIVIQDSADRTEWQLAEFTTLENKGAENYVHADSGGKRTPLRLQAPAGAQQLSATQSADRDAPKEPVATESGAVVLSDPLPPGKSLIITASYSLSAEPPLDLSRTLPLPMDEIVVLISNPNGKMVSSGFKATGTETIGGMNFQHFELKNAPAGQKIPIQAELPVSPSFLSAQLMLILRAQERDGYYDAIEFLHVQNDGSEDFSETDHDGNPIGLHIHLPKGAREVQAGGPAGRPLQTRVDNTGVSVIEPLPPGVTTVELAYSVPVDSPLDLSRSFHIPVSEIRAYLENPGAWIASPLFMMEGAETVHGSGSGAPAMRVNVFTRRGVPIGESVPIQTHFLGAAAPRSEGVPILLTALIGAFALAVGAAVGSWISQSRASNKKAPVENAPPHDPQPTGEWNRFGAKDLAAMKRLLLEHIAELDAQRERNALSRGAHRQMRQEAKTRLAGVIERMEAGS